MLTRCKNRCILEPNTKSIGWRVTELWPFEFFSHLGQRTDTGHRKTDTQVILHSVQCCHTVHWTDKNIDGNRPHLLYVVFVHKTPILLKLHPLPADLSYKKYDFTLWRHNDVIIWNAQGEDMGTFSMLLRILLWVLMPIFIFVLIFSNLFPISIGLQRPLRWGFGSSNARELRTVNLRLCSNESFS